MDLVSINHKLDVQLARIDTQLASESLSEQERQDLQIMHARLLKTRHLANSADELVQRDDERARRKIRVIGLVLCAISLVGLLGVAWLWTQL